MAASPNDSARAASATMPMLIPSTKTNHAHGHPPQRPVPPQERAGPARDPAVLVVLASPDALRLEVAP